MAIGVETSIKSLLSSISKKDATDTQESIIVKLEVAGKNNFLLKLDGVPSLPEVSGAGSTEKSEIGTSTARSATLT